MKAILISWTGGGTQSVVVVNDEDLATAVSKVELLNLDREEEDQVSARVLGVDTLEDALESFELEED